MTSIKALKRKGSVCPGEACWSSKDRRPTEPQASTGSSLLSALKTVLTCGQMPGKVDRCGIVQPESSQQESYQKPILCPFCRWWWAGFPGLLPTSDSYLLRY